jgi:L-2-hydroxycarboxylate dehydrogenase (NAD+)
LKTSIAINEIVDLSMKVLHKYGVSNKDAKIVIDHLLENELAGQPSHGFYKIPGIVKAIQETGVPNQIISEKETNNSVLINGGKQLGLVVVFRAMEFIIEKLGVAPLVMVGGYNYAGTTGTMGYFTRRIAESGYIGVMMANSDPCIPAWGGIQPIFGTNPISVSFPSMNDPFVVDFAASKWSWGDLAIAIKEDRKIPEGIVVDKSGNPSTDPNDARNCMLPFGEHKGYCLALVVELLAGPLVQAKAGTKPFSGSDGFIMIGINPDIFTSTNQFKMNTSKLIEEIKTSKRLPGVEELYYPGERSNRIRIENKKLTHITMVSQILDEIRALTYE